AASDIWTPHVRDMDGRPKAHSRVHRSWARSTVPEPATSADSGSHPSNAVRVSGLLAFSVRFGEDRMSGAGRLRRRASAMRSAVLRQELPIERVVQFDHELTLNT